MDDGVVLEPLVGNRIHHSLACLDETMKLVWGPEGVNVEKMAEEGHPSACQLLSVSIWTLTSFKCRCRSQNGSRLST